MNGTSKWDWTFIIVVSAVIAAIVIWAATGFGVQKDTISVHCAQEGGVLVELAEDRKVCVGQDGQIIPPPSPR